MIVDRRHAEQMTEFLILSPEDGKTDRPEKVHHHYWVYVGFNERKPGADRQFFTRQYKIGYDILEQTEFEITDFTYTNPQEKFAQQQASGEWFMDARCCPDPST